ncbi:hypothetical protein RhiirC2_849230 [Rhizophagus irregularis]|uniref:Uncharacterized protein n=1 Tax=Rhizophagus irregularis TaxID=588596 RepID=A0A2N1NBV9_9GLOM|nr:hypothetical protein RhiirC2_849230 [Rhizophagus irregularis]
MYGEEERPDRFGTKEDTNVWIEYIAKSVKEPTMRINLFRNPTNEQMRRHLIVRKSQKSGFVEKIFNTPKVERQTRWCYILYMNVHGLKIEVGFFEVVGNALINDNSFKNEDLIKLLKVCLISLLHFYYLTFNLKYGFNLICIKKIISYEKCEKWNKTTFLAKFKHWTGGNNYIDKFIQSTQLSAHKYLHKA